MGDHLRILLGVVVHSFLLLLHVAQDDEIFLAVLHLCLCVRAIIPLCVCVCVRLLVQEWIRAVPAGNIGLPRLPRRVISLKK